MLLTHDECSFRVNINKPCGFKEALNESPVPVVPLIAFTEFRSLLVNKSKYLFDSIGMNLQVSTTCLCPIIKPIPVPEERWDNLME
ncbi:unnamed protein product [[Candida] boidinii]|nr:unnamed protein product [[Candida] boidinii]